MTKNKWQGNTCLVYWSTKETTFTSTGLMVMMIVSWPLKISGSLQSQGLRSAKLQLCLQLIITPLYQLSNVSMWHSDSRESYDD
jgi:hypothetical protein